MNAQIKEISQKLRPYDSLSKSGYHFSLYSRRTESIDTAKYTVPAHYEPFEFMLPDSFIFGGKHDPRIDSLKCRTCTEQSCLDGIEIKFDNGKEKYSLSVGNEIRNQNFSVDLQRRQITKITRQFLVGNSFLS